MVVHTCNPRIREVRSRINLRSVSTIKGLQEMLSEKVKSFFPFICISLKKIFSALETRLEKNINKKYFSHLPLFNFPQHPPTCVSPNFGFSFYNCHGPSLIHAHHLKNRYGSPTLQLPAETGAEQPSLDKRQMLTF